MTRSSLTSPSRRPRRSIAAWTLEVNRLTAGLSAARLLPYLAIPRTEAILEQWEVGKTTRRASQNSQSVPQNQDGRQTYVSARLGGKTCPTQLLHIPAR